MKKAAMQIPFLLLIVASLLAVTVDGQEHCTVGDLLESASSSPMTGTLFLDIDHPAPCSGRITAWHFCHFAQRRILLSREFTALLQVWRPMAGTDTYERVAQSSQTDDVLNFGRSERFDCRDHILQESDFIPIEENDILAVYIPGSDGLRMVSDDFPGSRLYYIDTGADINAVTTSELAQEITGHELYLTADIAIETDLTTMTPTIMTTLTTDMNDFTIESTVPVTAPVTAPVTTPPNSTDSGTNQQSSDEGISGGGVAGIIIAIMILIGVIVAISVLGLLLWYKKGRGSSWDKRFKRKSQEVPSYDNTVYDEAPIRANSALTHYLNSTAIETGPMTDYEIPISTKSGAIAKPRNQMESMYIAMDGASVQKPLDSDTPDFTDSFETYASSEPDSERYAVHKRNRTVNRQSTDAVFDIYRSFGPENEVYCQFMEETVSQKGTLPHNATMGDFDPYADPPSNEEEICLTLSTKTQSIHHSKIQIMAEIGSGEFAFVNKAQWIEKSGASLTVAVKSLHSPASPEERIKFLQEAAIMSQFVHPNVVRLIGVVKTGDEISLVTEYCAKGDLCFCLKDIKSELGNLPPDTPQNLLSYSQQVALAMHYLSSKGFVHRDLAARNIFVTQENICKLGDFGMSRDLANAEYYVSQGGAIPVRWTAPEAVYYSKYSTASDIWSYGCLLFEIWSVGKKPFGGLPNTEVLETIKTGYRLPPPPGCPEAIYSIMIQCWDPQVKPRPAFRDILESMLRDDKELLYIPEEDAASYPLATQLGAMLEAGKGMYISLQHTYLTTLPINKRETIYEAIEKYLMESLPQTSQSSFSNAPPPLPSTPIPKADVTSKMSFRSPPATPPLSMRKTLLQQQSSICSLGAPPLPSSPKPSKTPLSQQLSIASLSSSYLNVKPSPLTKQPGEVRASNKQLIYSNVDDEIYDDVVGVMSSTNSATKNDDFIEDIYEDIADGSNMEGAPDTSVYEVPADARDNYNPYDVDYEDI